MLLSYVTTILAAAAVAFATPFLGAPTKVKRQLLPTPILYGPFRLKFIARWSTYRDKYAYVQNLDAVRPAPRSTGSVFNFENSTGRLWLGNNFLNPIVAGLRPNLTSNLAPLAFGPLGRPNCEVTGGVAYETAFSFNSARRLTLGGTALWHGCTTNSSLGLGPGANYQWGSGPQTTEDCQDIQLEYETA
ncbi:hypothetical protein EYR41_010896 [Orbilia oligospora]|uniref:Uncharacterized protein n=1 Tax=Orbilia oligospora TaxID=2813651 RepID=A0A7C8KKM3_ORBOL|nr:hypothetical protein TWF751_008727 [Orbilia oligospora]TGJ62944.1 hypothetical protein EYR41_010896 [Orbilia oligospora]